MAKFLDLFAGAGGLSEGFIQAGYTPVAHVEMDVAACYTLKTRAAFHWLKTNGDIELYNQYLRGEMTRNEFYAHIPQAVLDTVLNYEISSDTIPEIFEKIDQMLGREKLDLIIGGPPCQAYSLAGRSRSETKMVGDKRNYLYKHYTDAKVLSHGLVWTAMKSILVAVPMYEWFSGVLRMYGLLIPEVPFTFQPMMNRQQRKFSLYWMSFLIQ